MVIIIQIKHTVGVALNLFYFLFMIYHCNIRYISVCNWEFLSLHNQEKAFDLTSDLSGYVHSQVLTVILHVILYVIYSWLFKVVKDFVKKTKFSNIFFLYKVSWIIAEDKKKNNLLWPGRLVCAKKKNLRTWIHEYKWS